jgi:signal peptidase I
MAFFTFGLGNLPITNFAWAVVALVTVIALLIALYVAPAVVTWRESALHTRGPWWSRWYGLTATAAIMVGLSQIAPVLMHSFYKPFYAPSVSMAPTIGKGDKFVVDMRWRGPLMRGDVVVFRAQDGDRISRIAGIPGDRIAMRDGVPVVNGTAATQRRYGSEAFADYDGPRQAAAFKEHLPGEASTHTVLDAGSYDFDDIREVVIPAGHFFVLGDNRDRAADSRMPPDMSGVGMVPVASILGRAMYIDWSSNRAKIGTRLDR